MESEQRGYSVMAHVCFQDKNGTSFTLSLIFPQILQCRHYYSHFIAVEIDPVSSQTISIISDHQAGRGLQVERCRGGWRMWVGVQGRGRKTLREWQLFTGRGNHYPFSRELSADRWQDNLCDSICNVCPLEAQHGFLETLAQLAERCLFLSIFQLSRSQTCSSYLEFLLFPLISRAPVNN